jgi:hypothetical protein
MTARRWVRARTRTRLESHRPTRRNRAQRALAGPARRSSSFRWRSSTCVVGRRDRADGGILIEIVDRVPTEEAEVGVIPPAPVGRGLADPAVVAS